MARRGLFVAAILLIVLLFFVGGLLLVRALPILQDYPLVQLLTSVKWRPTHGEFGLAPFIAGSFAVTMVAMVLAVVPAVFSGIYLAEYTSSKRRTMLKPILDLLAGIPSVVYGLSVSYTHLAAAEQISAGDLAAPIPRLAGPPELASLSASLEKSQATMLDALDERSQARDWLNTLIQSVVEGVVTFDTRGRVTFMSQGAETLSGWSSAEAVGCLLYTSRCV